MLGSGFNRLASIDDAKASMRGLQYTEEQIESVTKSALAAVDGTAYGLDSAVTAATGALGAGVKLGDELTGYISLIGDMTKQSKTDFNSMAVIMNKIRGTGKLTGTTLDQLVQNGLQAGPMLAEWLGVGIAEMQKMVAAGEVSAGEFERIMLDKIGGSAQESGKTVRGAWSNVKAAFSRMGAAILGGEEGIGILPAFFTTIKERVNGFTAAINGAWAWLRENQDTVMPIVKALGAMAAVWAGIQGGIKLATTAMVIFNAVTKKNLILAAISGIVAAISWLWQTNEGFRDWVTSAWETISNAFSSAWDNIQGVWKLLTQGEYDGGLLSIPADHPLVGFLTTVRDTAIDLWNNTQGVWKLLTEGEYDGGLLSIPADHPLVGFLTTVRDTAIDLWNGAQGVWKLLTEGDYDGGLLSIGDDHPFVAFLVAVRDTAIELWNGAQGVWKLLTEGDYDGGLLSIGDDHPFVAFLVAVREGVTEAATAVKNAWEGHIQPALAALSEFVLTNIGPAISWLWQKVFVPAFKGIWWAVQVAWNVIRLVFDAVVWAVSKVVAPIISWLWKNVFVPAFKGIWWAVQVAWNVIRLVFDLVVWTVRNIVAPAVKWLWEKIFSPVFSYIGEKIEQTWNFIKPILETLGAFVTNTVAPGIERGVATVISIWESLRDAFAKPINWVLDTVWNKGIVTVFENVAKAIGSDARLPKADLIQLTGATKSAISSAVASSGGSSRAFARGGYAAPGWALVGEEGPELVNFTDPGRVYTATETAKALAEGRDLSPALARSAVGGSPRESLVPAGGGVISSAVSWVGEQVGKVVDWVRGGLAAAAGLVLDPIVGGISSALGGAGTFGQVVGDTATSMVDNLKDWIRGKDAEGGDGQLLSAGAWMRPTAGPVTSRFGPRWGSFHAGIDVAGGGPTYAARDGIVERVGWNAVPGRTGIGILLNHGPGLWSYYGHNPVGGARVAVGDAVRKGRHIGYQGSTGNATGDHLHFEVHQGGIGRAINPEQIGVFDGGGMLGQGEMALHLGRRPDRVLTEAQWDAIYSLAGNAAAIPNELVIVDVNNELVGRMRVEADGAVRGLTTSVGSAMAGLSRGGKYS